MFFRGNGLDGSNVSNITIDNLKLYEVYMIPFFKYFTSETINVGVQVPLQGIAPFIDYSDSTLVISASTQWPQSNAGPAYQTTYRLKQLP